MEENNKKCPECGSTELGEGILNSRLEPKDAIFASSRVTARVCTKCGCILSMKVTDPEKFR